MSTLENLPPEPEHKKLEKELIGHINDRYIAAGKLVFGRFNGSEGFTEFTKNQRDALSKRKYLKPLNAFMAESVPCGGGNVSIRNDRLVIRTGLILGLRVSDTVCTPFTKRQKILHRAVPHYFADLAASSQGSIYGLRDTLFRGQEQDIFRRAAIDMLPQSVHEVWKDASPTHQSRRDLLRASMGYTAQLGLVAYVEDSLYSLAPEVPEPEAAALEADLYAGIAKIGVMPSSVEPPRATGS